MRGDLGGALALGCWRGAARLAAPALGLLLARRARAGREIAARLGERRGIHPAIRPEGRLIWVHAASVGETMSVLPVLHALAARAPLVALLLTTGTVTSAQLAAERLPPGALHQFVPLDVPRWVQRFLDHWRPDVGCFVESELWPALLSAAVERGIPLALLNARVSASSFRNWRRAPGFARRLLGGFGLIWARSAADAARIAALAGREIPSPGDLKFAAPALPGDFADLRALVTQFAGRPTWVAASLHAGEDAAVVHAHEFLSARHPGLITVLVPRHPDRGAAIAAAYAVARRSAGEPVPSGGLYLADTLGELGLFYRLAACVFMGGSLVARGGQNPLEPARLGRPVAIGPHHENFAEACAALRAAGGLTDVAGAASLAAWADCMLGDPAARALAGQAAQAAADRWADLPDRSAAALLELMRR